MKTPRKSDILRRIEQDFMEEPDMSIDIHEDSQSFMKDWEADVLRKTRRPN